MSNQELLYEYDKDNLSYNDNIQTNDTNNAVNDIEYNLNRIYVRNFWCGIAGIILIIISVLVLFKSIRKDCEISDLLVYSIEFVGLYFFLMFSILLLVKSLEDPSMIYGWGLGVIIYTIFILYNSFFIFKEYIKNNPKQVLKLPTQI